MYLETTEYFDERSIDHGVNLRHVREALSIEVYGEEQPDGRVRLAGYVDRVAEIVIEHASRRTDLDDIRRRVGFEEVDESRR